MQQECRICSWNKWNIESGLKQAWPIVSISVLLPLSNLQWTVKHWCNHFLTYWTCSRLWFDELGLIMEISLVRLGNSLVRFWRIKGSWYARQCRTYSSAACKLGMGWKAPLLHNRLCIQNRWSETNEIFIEVRTWNELSSSAHLIQNNT